jgi:hypothetical protein
MAGRMINGAAALAELVRPAGDTAEPGVHRVLPVVPELSNLLPGRGLRRGSTVAVATGRAAPGSGGTSLLLALLSEASRSGSWCAVVGVPALGALAAAESGIALDRLALVPNPGPEWPTVVAALIDGVDVVVTAVPGPVSASVATRLAARARQRGSVLMPFGQWDGADVTLQVTQGRWEGLGPGRGRLRRRMVTVLARGRGAAARPRESTMWMPGLTASLPAPPTVPCQVPDPRPADVPGPPGPGQPAAASGRSASGLPVVVSDGSAPDRPVVVSDGSVPSLPVAASGQPGLPVAASGRSGSPGVGAGSAGSGPPAVGPSRGPAPPTGRAAAGPATTTMSRTRAGLPGTGSVPPTDTAEPPCRRNRAPGVSFPSRPDPVTHHADHPDRHGEGRRTDRCERNDRFGARRAHSRSGRG